MFDDVLIPWDRVFLYNDVKMGNALFAQASIRNHTGHQTAIRGLAKCQLMTGIAIAMTRTVKSDVFLHVQEQLGELLGYLQLIEAAILMAEQKAEPTGRGALRPAYAPLQALRYHLPKMYERMVQVTQVLSAGGLLINPMEADLQSEIGPDIARYYRGAGVDADKRIQLSKLAWDATGTQFGQRMLQYERYYAGDPVRVGASYYLDHDVAPLLAQVERALKGSRAVTGACRRLKTCVRRTTRRARRSPPVCPARRCRSHADAADDVAVDDDRQAARQVDALALRGDGELEVDAGRDIAGRDPIGGGGHRLHQRRVDGLREGAVHAAECQQVAAAIDDGNALRHAHLLRLRHRGIEELHCAVRCQLQRR